MKKTILVLVACVVFSGCKDPDFIEIDEPKAATKQNVSIDTSICLSGAVRYVRLDGRTGLITHLECESSGKDYIDRWCEEHFCTVINNDEQSNED